ncbi:glycosyltransferase family 4 protein [Bacillus sp. es.036]|uniref:glycosyltransferase family 4 protein n=1 Tax=Bacillus sp. es.036 TaxID=1761764 RepID=UPI000BF85258|nr:glycosyltransferase family 4 protein [Bacillus sp. es.036]PFG12719.1 glycosyltransferase involved in cell wall biosynthesis [Bacillus sp. es.036]
MKKVSILTHSFLDAYNNQITKLYGGGLERYLYELCLILKEKEIDVEVHQLSFNESFETKLESTEIAGTIVYGYYCDDLDKIADIFEEMAKKASGSLIYASCIWHPIQYRPNSLGICHGINWDRIDLVIEAKDQVKENVQRAVTSLSKIVSVDSHFLSYCRSVCHYDDPEKIELIPNFVDTEKFVPGDAKAVEGGRLRVLFPRRISHERGILLMMAATDLLLQKFPQVEIMFAGEMIKETDICRVFQYWMKVHPNKDRIIHEVCSFEDMPDVYQKADIVVIPTVYSEGTSLSCLEALSAGLPVIATNVGGLNDIIVDGFNGYLITPTTNRLVATISELITNREKRSMIASHARETAKAFDRSIWQNSWRGVLEEYLQE